MKKTAICVAIGLQALTIGVAHAQSSVTIYGVVDAFVEFGKAGTEAEPKSQTRLQSGGTNGSRLGFRAVEDLGGGLKANAVLEHGLLVDSGEAASASAFWNRQSFVGLSGDFGGITAGRQYSPLIAHQDSFDPALSTTGYGSAYNSGVMRTVSRVNNSLLYKTPAVGGFSAAVMLGLGESTAGGSHGNVVSASAKYASGPLGVGFAFARQNKPEAGKEDKLIWNLATSYQFGDVQLFGALQGTKNDSQNAATLDDRNEFMLGAVYSFGANQIRTSFGQAKVKGVSDSTVRHGSLAYVYNMSKSTALYAAVQAIDNPKNLAYRSGGYTFDAVANGLPAGSNVTARAVAFGMRHRF
jgi:predicted porin